ncbi:hypothetical protein [Caldivirga sp.]|uniref:hypothetical protein n=1 Tax=Caldivirga sp. TaxID=2080243 RepID=UPI0025C393D8|nr:hypothetical protein [Caldivirga sp.]
MSSAQANKLRICWGIKRGRKLVCKEPVTDEKVIEEVKRLIEELKRRIERHKDRLENATFIDELIVLLKQWLKERKNDKGKKAKDAGKIVRKMIKLLKRLRKKWIETYWKQFFELMDLLEEGAADIIVIGGNGNGKSLVARLRNGDVAVAVERVATSNGVIINLALKDLKGEDVKVSNTFSDREAMEDCQHGFHLTDGSTDYGYPAMVTTQPWQVVLWSLCYPGKVRMRIGSISINEGDVSIIWRLIAKDHRARSKAKIAEEVEKLDLKRLKAFLASAVFGDGDVNVSKKYIRLIMGLSKFELWLDILMRLINELGFIIKLREYKVEAEIWSSKAIGLAKDWLGMPEIRELIKLGASLPDSKKLRGIIELASKEVKKLGGSSINIPGTNISMTVRIKRNYKVELRAWRRDEGKVLRLIKELKRTGYELTIYVDGNGRAISITHNKVKSDKRLKEPVCELLYRWLNEVRDEKRKVKIVATIQSLECFDNT